MERVKISYAVDLEEVPQTANDLMLDVQHWMAEVSESIGRLNFNSGVLADITNEVHNIRRTLARIDQRMDDCYAITVGYHETLLPRPEHPPEVATASVEDKLRELQAAMEAAEPHEEGT